MSAPTNKIKPAERAAVLSSLHAGVVPRVGQHLIQVGRQAELDAIAKDLETVADGGSSFRLLIGDYGSGKTFFLNRIRTMAFEKKFVTVHADLTPEIRLRGSDGQARALYSNLMSNISIRARPDGRAMSAIVEQFVNEVQRESALRDISTGKLIEQRLEALSELTNGYAFAKVVGLYWKAHETMDEHLKASAIQWLRAGFNTRTEANNELKLRDIIDDDNFHDNLKLMALFVRQAGFKGLMVCLDEMVNLYKLTNKQARDSNYETLLGILNDSLQGNAAGLGFVFGGTPEFLTDTRRGLFSYPALSSRLADNPFSRAGLVDYTAPVIRLANLSRADLYQLMVNIRHVQAAGDLNAYLLPDQALHQFLEIGQQRLGDAYFGTPRNTARDFTALLSILEGNPQTDWCSALAAMEMKSELDQEAWPEENLAATAGSMK